MTPGSRPDQAQFDPAELRELVEAAHRCGLPVTAHAHAIDGIRNALRAGVDGVEHCTFLTPAGVQPPPADLVAALVARRTAIGATVGIAPSPIPPPPAVRKILADLGRVYRRLRAAGALVVAATDAGIAPAKPHGVLPYAVSELAATGATPAEALRTCTAVAATVCGLGDRKGRLAAGFDADLIAVPGDPLVDLAVLHRPVAVVVGGQPVTATAATH